MKTLLLAALLIGPSATIPLPPQTGSIAGEWDAEMTTPGGVRSFKIVFQVEGEKLTGTVKRAAGDVPLVGTIKADTVRFSYSVLYNDNALELTMLAVVSGDTMKGTVDFAGAAQDAFSARRAKPAGTSKP